MDRVLDYGICGTSTNTTTFVLTQSANEDGGGLSSCVGKPLAMYDVSNSNAVSVRYITVFDSDNIIATVNAAPSFTRQDGVDLYRLLDVPTIGGTGAFLTILGVATSTSNLQVSITASSVAQA